MSGDDPDYLKGVDQPGFDEADNFTVRPGSDGPLTHEGYDKRRDEDFDDEDDEEEASGPRIPWPLILLVVIVLGALGTLGAAAVAATGTWIRDAEGAALAQAGELARAVEEERRIVDELAAKGADRKRLQAGLTAVQSAEGHARGLAALAFTRQVDAAIATVGDVRGTPVDDRHKKLAYAQGRYEDALGTWDTAAGNPFGAIAVGIGMADGPPTR